MANRDFVYWFSSVKKFKLAISPKEDKTTKIEIVFQFPPPDKDKYTFWSFYKIGAVCDDEKVIIDIAKPKFVSYAIDHLLSAQNGIFEMSNEVNGIGLLNEMGYFELEPVWIGEW